MGKVWGPTGFHIGTHTFPHLRQRLARCNTELKLSKCFKSVNSAEDSTDLQIDLDNLCDWATLNELDFQPKKCANLRISRKLCSFDRVYIINRMDHLKCLSSQRDLGVVVTKTYRGTTILNRHQQRLTKCLAS